MDYSSTLNSIIQLSYSELTNNERSVALDKMSESEDLCDTFSQIEQIKTVLDSEMYSPNPTSVKIILEESQRSELEMH